MLSAMQISNTLPDCMVNVMKALVNIHVASSQDIRSLLSYSLLAFCGIIVKLPGKKEALLNELNRSSMVPCVFILTNVKSTSCQYDSVPH